MRNIKEKFLTVIVPAIVLMPLLWLLAGCFYVPWFEHRLDRGPNIRALIGPPISDRDIRPGNITKSRVIAILGHPRFESSDGSAIGYVTRTGTGYWVWPLCFEIEQDDKKVYAVRLIFDAKGNLAKFDWATESYSNQSFGSEAISELNRRGGPQLINPEQDRLERELSGTTQP